MFNLYETQPEDTAASEQQPLASGLATPDTGFAVAPVTDDARDTRYLFNAFMVCDVRFLPHPVGHQYLKNGQFIKISTVVESKKRDDYQYIPQSPYSNGADELNTRYAGHITTDLINLYSGMGIVEIAALRGVDDDVLIGGLSTALLGQDIPTKTDVYFDEHPCPTLPFWFEQIEANYRSARAEVTEDPIKVKILDSVFADLSAAFVRAREVATAITQAAVNRSLQPNARPFDALERRAFLALGQQIPELLPTVTANANDRAARLEDAYMTMASNMNQPAAPSSETNLALEAVLQTNRMMQDEITQSRALIADMQARMYTPQEVKETVKEQIKVEEKQSVAKGK